MLVEITLCGIFIIWAYVSGLVAGYLVGKEAEFQRLKPLLEAKHKKEEVKKSEGAERYDRYA